MEDLGKGVVAIWAWILDRRGFRESDLGWTMALCGYGLTGNPPISAALHPAIYHPMLCPDSPFSDILHHLLEITTITPLIARYILSSSDQSSLPSESSPSSTLTDIPRSLPTLKMTLGSMTHP